MKIQLRLVEMRIQQDLTNGKQLDILSANNFYKLLFKPSVESEQIAKLIGTLILLF